MDICSDFYNACCEETGISDNINGNSVISSFNSIPGNRFVLTARSKSSKAKPKRKRNKKVKVLKQVSKVLKVDSKDLIENFNKSLAVYKNIQKEGLKQGLVVQNKPLEEKMKKVGNFIKKEVGNLAKKEGKKLLNKVVAPAVEGAISNSGIPLGGELGNIAGGGIRMIAGSGDYKVQSNTLTTMGVAHNPEFVPEFISRNKKGNTNGTRVRHREYLGDIISSSSASAFSITTYAINPGNSTIFPWLSTIAQNYDQWVPNGIVVSFKSTSSVFNGSTQGLGTVIIASDYDLLDSQYASKIEMENSQYAVSCKCSDNILHPLECAPNQRQVRCLKIRGVNTPTDNIQWYDLCNTQVATVGIGGTSVTLGELWITYDITFFKEQIYGGLIGNGVYESVWSGATSISTSAYLGTDWKAGPNNTTGVVFNGTTTFTFPATTTVGTYALNYLVVGSSSAASIPTFTLTGCSLVNGPQPQNYDTFSTTAGVVAVQRYIKITAASATIVMSSGTLLTSPTKATAYIILLNPGTTV